MKHPLSRRAEMGFWDREHPFGVFDRSMMRHDGKSLEVREQASDSPCRFYLSTSKPGSSPVGLFLWIRGDMDRKMQPRICGSQSFSHGHDSPTAILRVFKTACPPVATAWEMRKHTRTQHHRRRQHG